MLLLLVFLVFLLILQSYDLYLLNILYLVQHHFLPRIHYFLLVEFLNSHNLLQYFLFLHQVFQQHQLDLVPEIELTSNDLLIDLARIGLGIAFVPDYCIFPDSEDVFILHTKEELPERELAIAYNEHLPLSRASMEFLSYFRDKTC